MANEFLDQDNFEKYIAVNTSKDNLKIIFNATHRELDTFCREIYGLDFDTTYVFLLQQALAEYKNCLRGLAIMGNATAMNTLNQLVLNMSNQQEMKITVCADVPCEDPEKDDHETTEQNS